MKEFTVAACDDGKRLDRVLKREAPGLGVSLMQKYIRLKRITVNGARTTHDAHVAAGDIVRVFAELDETPRAKRDAFLSAFRWRLMIVYEDDALLLVDKRPGLLVHPDAREKVQTLTTHVRAYLYQKGAYDSMDARAFAPTPVNRIDRFTGGIVLFAKTRDALDTLNRLIRARRIQKEYLLLVKGVPRPATGTLDNYIVKETSRVRVSHTDAPGAQRAITRYRVLESENDRALVACELVTGRTHQIRAQFADFGHPLLGDMQYGDKRLNERLHMSAQALYAYRIAFDGGADVPEAVRARTFTVARVPFARIPQTE